MSPSTVYLVTGANRSRGIGFSIAAHILAKHENAFVYAGARGPERATALIELKEKYPGRIAIVKCVSADSEGNAAMAEEIEKRHGRVDTVIANAGRWLNSCIFNAVASVHQAAVKDLEEHFQINVVGPIVLFQSVYHLLKKSANPRFIPMSSPGGSISGPIVTFEMGTVIYASTKATLNWVTRIVKCVSADNVSILAAVSKETKQCCGRVDPTDNVGKERDASKTDIITR